MADVYERLVLNDWWTRADAISGDDGTAEIRAFLGTHQITVTVGDQTYTSLVTVDKNQDGRTDVAITISN